MSRYFSRTDRRRISKQSRNKQSVGVVFSSLLPGNQLSVRDLAAEIEARQMHQEQEIFDAAATPAVIQEGATK